MVDWVLHIMCFTVVGCFLAHNGERLKSSGWFEMVTKRVVMIAGGFDPIHLGHLSHIQEAKMLGDFLLVVTHSDEDMIAKKGYCLLPLKHRVAVLDAILKDYPHQIVTSIDKDGAVAETLRYWKPDIFAKGGDRTPDNMPLGEIKTCQEIGCAIVYGKGELLGSSSDFFRRAYEQFSKRTP